MNNLDYNSDPDWQAYRYVAQEMSDEEQLEFELQLAADPELCGCVADMQLLCTAIAANEPSLPSSVRELPRTRHTVRWAAVALAGLMAVTVWMLAQPARPLGWIGDPVAQRTDDQHTGLMSTLADARVLSAWSSLQPETALHDVATPLDDEAIDVASSVTSVPDWMLVAVASETGAERDGLLPDVDESQGAESL